MRIDAQQHFTREYLPSLLLPILKRNRFDGTVAVARTPSVEETRWLLDLAREHEYIRAVVGWADLRSSAAAGLLDEYSRHPKFRGVHWSGEATEAMAELELRGLSLDLRSGDPASIAERFPAVRMAVVYDGASPLPELPPRVFLKIAGLITGRPTQWKAADFEAAIRDALAAYGPERIMFGSDWPSYLPEGTWKEALAAFTQAIGAQTVDVREKLLGETARGFYRIEGGEA